MVPASSRVGWWNAAFNYRLRLDLASGASARSDFPVEVELSFAAIFSAAGLAGTFDPASVRLVEIDAVTGAIIAEKPSRYDQQGATNRGVLFTSLDGATAANTTRSYHVYFDVTQSGPKPVPAYWSSTAATTLENAQVRIGGINQNQDGAQAGLSFADGIIKSSGVDAMYVRYTRLGSSLGSWGSPLTGYATCVNSTNCALAANVYGAALSAPTQILTSPGLKVNLVVIPAGAITVRQYLILATGAGVRVYTRFENTGAVAATGVTYWDGADVDVLGTSATDDTGVHNSDDSLVVSETVSPGAAALRGTLPSTGWDLRDRVKVMEAVIANAPANQPSSLALDVGWAARFPVADVAPGSFSALRTAFAFEPTRGGAQASVAALSTVVTPTISGGVESRCNAGVGTFVSPVFDSLAAGTQWLTIGWTAGLPSGTSLTLQTRSGNSPVPDGSWSVLSTPPYAVPAGNPIVSPAARYLQLQATLTPSGSGACPSLHDVTVAYDATASALSISEIPNPIESGLSTSLRVTAREPLGGIARNYLGQVAFTSTDPQASLPAGFTFTPADQGTRVVSGLVLRTPGTRTVTAREVGLPTTGSQAVLVRGRDQVRFRWYSSALAPLAAENTRANLSPGQQVHLRVGVRAVGATWFLSDLRFPPIGETLGNVASVTGTWTRLLAADGLTEVLTEAKTGPMNGWRALGNPSVAGNPEHAFRFGTAVPTGRTSYLACFTARTSLEKLNVGWSATTTPAAITFPAGWQITSTSLIERCFDLRAAGYLGGALTLYVQDALRGSNADGVVDTFTLDKLEVRVAEATYLALERSDAPDFSVATQVAAAELWDDPANTNGAALTPLLSGTGTPEVFIEQRPSLASNQLQVPAGQIGEWDFALVAPAASPQYYRLVLTDALGARLKTLEGISTLVEFGLPPPFNLAFATPAQSVVADACSALTTVAVRDPVGTPTVVNASTLVTLTPSSSTAGFFADASCTLAISSFTLTTGAGAADVYFKDPTAGALVLGATAPGFGPGTQLQTIIAASAAALAFISPAQVVAAGACSQAAVVEIRDAFGNPAPQAVARGVALASSSATAGFFLDASCLNATSSATIGVGASSTSFYFREPTAGEPSIDVSAATLSGATQLQSVLSGIASALAFKGPATKASAGVCSPAVTVASRDAFGNAAPVAVSASVALTSSSTTLAFFSDPACALATATALISAGNDEASLYFKDNTAGSHQLIAAALGLGQATGVATVDPRAAVGLAFVTAPQTIVTGECSAPIEVRARDSFGNTSAVGAVTAVGLTSNRPTLTFHATAGCPGAVTSVALAAGSSSVSFFVRDSVVGAGSLTAASTGLTPASQGLTVVAPSGLQGRGEACALAGECGSGFCAGGVCCDRACTAVCEWCGFLGGSGTCGPSPNGAPCDDPGFCNGSELCVSGACVAGAPACVDPEQPLVCVEAQRTCVATPSVAALIVREAMLTAGQGVAYPYSAFGRVRSTGTQPITFSTCAGPAGFAIEPSSGAIDWTPQGLGPVPLCVKATNAFGSDSYAFTVQVAAPLGAGPVAAFAVDPSSGPAPLLAGFDGSASSSDVSTPLAAYRWDYGVRSPYEAGLTSSFRYLLPGGYQPELTVIDSAGRTAAARRGARALNEAGKRPPLARIVASRTSGSDTLTVDLSCDCQPGDSPIAAWWWELGGSFSTAAELSHVFSPGRYHLRLTVVDEAGLTASDMLEIAVSQGGQQPPHCRLFADPPAELAPFTTRLRATFLAPGGAITAHEISFSDGTTTADVLARRDCPTPGRYRADLKVTADSSLTCEDSAEVVAIGQDRRVPPRIFSLPERDAECGVAYRYGPSGRPIVAGSGPIKWSVKAAPGASLPTGVQADGEGGAILWTPSGADTGTQSFVLVAESPAGRAEQRIDVEVTCADRQLQVGCGCSQAGGWLASVALLLAALRRVRKGSSRRDGR